MPAGHRGVHSPPTTTLYFTFTPGITSKKPPVIPLLANSFTGKPKACAAGSTPAEAFTPAGNDGKVNRRGCAEALYASRYTVRSLPAVIVPKSMVSLLSHNAP